MFLSRNKKGKYSPGAKGAVTTRKREEDMGQDSNDVKLASLNARGD